MSIASAIIVVLVHELSKRVVAYNLTQPILRSQIKKVKLTKYIDPIGIIMFVFSGIGWQMPAEYSPKLFKDHKKAILTIVLTGFVANLLFMSVLIPIEEYLYAYPYLHLFVFYLIKFNFVIAFVNLLPVPPLDMAKIMYAYTPNAYFKLIENVRIIHILFILLLVIGVISMIINALFLGTVGVLIR